MAYLGSRIQKKVFSLFFKLGNSYFCITMGINRERRIKDGTEKGEGGKEGKENIHNFLWKANNKVGPEMTNAPYLFWSLLVMILGRVFTDFEWPLPASFGTLTTLSINVLCSAQLLPWGPTLCKPMDYSLTGSSRQEYSPGKNTGVGCHALLQGIVPTQGSNLNLLMSTCFGRKVLYH